jgi:uncharacterized protein (TIGR00369 family)
MKDESTKAATAPARERLVTWSDPQPTLQASRGMAGLDVLLAMGRGELPLPPVLELVGITPVSAEHGRVVMQLTPHESHYNVLGMMHGGMVTTLLDTVVGCAVHTTLPAGRGYTSLNISVSFIKAVTLGSGTVVAEGSVVHAGRSTAIARGEIRDAAGKLYATAESTCLIFDRPLS